MKNECYKKIIVPFRHANHVARDNEETLYRKCLANSANFPNLQQEDFISCSNGNMIERLDVLSNHFANEATNIFNIVRN